MSPCTGQHPGQSVCYDILSINQRDGSERCLRDSLFLLLMRTIVALEVFPYCASTQRPALNLGYHPLTNQFICTLQLTRSFQHLLLDLGSGSPRELGCPACKPVVLRYLGHGQSQHRYMYGLLLSTKGLLLRLNIDHGLARTPAGSSICSARLQQNRKCRAHDAACLHNVHAASCFANLNGAFGSLLDGVD